LAALLALFAYGACGQTAPPPLTLHDAVALVLERNPALRESLHAIEASKARSAQSRSGYLPSASVDASYVYLAPLSIFTLPGGSIKVFPDNNWDGHIGIRQTVYDFSKTATEVSVADARTTLVEDSRATLTRDLSFRTAETFYGILFLRRSVAVQDEQVKTLQEHLEITKRKTAAGTATQLDELTTQVRVAEAQNVRIRLQNNLQNAEIAMRRLAALEPGAPLELRGEFTAPEVKVEEDSLLKVAARARIEAKSAADAVTTARVQQDAARASDAPSIGASVMYGFKNGYIPNLDVMRGNLAASVDFHLPVFDGNRTSAMEEEALSGLQAAETRQQDVALAIQAEVEGAIAELRAARERVEVSETNILQATLAVKNARLRYDAGTLANLDLLDAETALAEARLTNLQALYDAILGTLRLQRATGGSADGE
ncbi:MAG TPA: TolC family protein, partial [Bacteroidota bacterium]|nr:TolC family protein [Bacteroidota bacterium]